MNYTLNGKLLTTGGGPSVPTSFVNTGFSATGAWTYSRPFTATQTTGPQYATASATASLTTATIDGVYIGFQLDDTSVFPLDNTPANLEFAGNYQSWGEMPDTGIVYGQGIEIGTYRLVKYSPSFTATATFTANTESFPYYIRFGEMRYYSATAYPGVTATTYTKTGEGKPYPQYPDSTEGVMTASVSGSEGWANHTPTYVSMNKTCSYGATYDNGPDSSLYTPPSSQSVTAFKGGELSSFVTDQISTYTGIADTGYTYSYGAITSAYNGYTGI